MECYSINYSVQDIELLSICREIWNIEMDFCSSPDGILSGFWLTLYILLLDKDVLSKFQLNSISVLSRQFPCPIPIKTPKKPTKFYVYICILCGKKILVLFSTFLI